MKFDGGHALDCQMGDGAEGLTAILQRETCLTELYLAGTSRRRSGATALHFSRRVSDNKLGPEEMSTLQPGWPGLVALELLDLAGTPPALHHAEGRAS